MRSKTTLVIAVLLSSALLVTGCAKPPQVEIDAAKAALDAAVAAKADTYAGPELAAAREALSAAQAEIDTQAGKFALFRSYKNAKTLLADAVTKANAARDAAVTNMETAKQEASAAIEAAKAAVAGAQTEVASLEGCRRKPKGFAADLTVIKGTLDGLVAELPNLDSSFASEDYLGAKSAAEALSSRAATLVTDVQNAKTKIKC